MLNILYISHQSSPIGFPKIRDIDKGQGMAQSILTQRTDGHTSYWTLIKLLDTSKKNADGMINRSIERERNRQSMKCDDR